MSETGAKPEVPFLEGDDAALLAKRRQLVGAALWLAVLPSGLMLVTHLVGGTVHSGYLIAMGVGWALYYAAVFLAWRCPACRRRIGNNPRVRHCPNCGVGFPDVARR